MKKATVEKCHYSLKNATKRVKGKAIDGEKIFVTLICDNGLAPRIYKELLQANKKKTIQ